MTKGLEKRRQGRQKVPLEEARAIGERLRQFVGERYPNRAAFADMIGVPRTTVTGWFSSPPRTPETPHLLKLAKEANLNLNWLLLGEGPEVRPEVVPWDKLALRVRDRVQAELRAQYGLGDLRIPLHLLGFEEALEEVLRTYARIVWQFQEVSKLALDLQRARNQSNGQSPPPASVPEPAGQGEGESDLQRRFDEAYRRLPSGSG
jgi:hypothetical protein